jgi:hypothetical protein
LATSRTAVEVSSSASRRAVDRIESASRSAAPRRLVGLPLGVGAQLGGIVPGASHQLGRISPGRGLGLAGFRSSRLDQLGGLLLGQPQQLLDPGAEAGIGGALLLMDLAVNFGQLLLQGLGLLAVLAPFGFDLPDVLVDLLTVIAPHRRHEVTRLGFLEGISRLSVNVRLHVARS